MRRMKIWLVVVVAVAEQFGFAALTPGDMSLAMFKAGRVSEPTVFKAKVALLSQNNGTWYDESPLLEVRDQFWALRVAPIARRQDAGFSGIVCYAKKNSAAGKIIEQALRDGAYHVMNVQLRYSTKEAPRDFCEVDAIEPLDQTAGEVTARLGATRIGVTKNEKFDYLQGKITVSYRTRLKFFKKPILRVVLLTDENGARVVRDCIIDEPDVKMLGSSDTVERNTTTAGNSQNEPPLWHRYIEDISRNQTEVSADRYRNASYVGLPLGSYSRLGLKGYKTVHVFGYGKFDKDEKAKMIGYRIEVWHDGTCIEEYDTIRASDLKRLSLPDDWHVSFMHPEKFKYRSPFYSKQVVR